MTFTGRLTYVNGDRIGASELNTLASRLVIVFDTIVARDAAWVSPDTPPVNTFVIVGENEDVRQYFTWTGTVWQELTPGTASTTEDDDTYILLNYAAANRTSAQLQTDVTTALSTESERGADDKIDVTFTPTNSGSARLYVFLSENRTITSIQAQVGNAFADAEDWIFTLRSDDIIHDGRRWYCYESNTDIGHSTEETVFRIGLSDVIVPDADFSVDDFVASGTASSTVYQRRLTLPANRALSEYWQVEFRITFQSGSSYFNYRSEYRTGGMLVNLPVQSLIKSTEDNAWFPVGARGAGLGAVVADASAISGATTFFDIELSDVQLNFVDGSGEPRLATNRWDIESAIGLRMG